MMRTAAPLVRRAAAFVAVALIAIAVARPVQAGTRERLRTAKQRLAAVKERIRQESAVIASLQRQVNDLALELDRVQSQIAETQFRILKKEQEIDDTQAQVDAAQAQLDRRAWVAYENGPGSSLDFLLGATSLADLSTRLEIVDRVAQSDQDLIIELKTLENQLLIKKAELESLQQELTRRRSELEQRQQQIQAKMGQEQAALDRLRRDRVEAERLVQRLTARLRQEELARLAALAAQQGHGGPVAGGVFQVCPVDQPRAYGDDFGAPRDTTNPPHPHAGVDIVAPLGTPIRAPFPGTASEASNDLGGLSVKVYGALGYVYNAHLSALGQLGPVQAGDVIGYVGNSGDAQGGITHDHFEWHPNEIPPNPYRSAYGYTVIGTAIDPYPYLNAVC